MMMKPRPASHHFFNTSLFYFYFTSQKEINEVVGDIIYLSVMIHVGSSENSPKKDNGTVPLS